LEALRRKILIVEDHDDTREFLVAHFGAAGYEVETATDGNSAIAAALRLRPDVIVLDLSLPGLDGADALAVMRSYPSTIDTPVVVVSGHPELLQKRALQYSVALRKPCTPFDVEAAVAEALGAVVPNSAPRSEGRKTRPGGA
jgi:CheY-like chemotaxis protein